VGRSSVGVDLLLDDADEVVGVVQPVVLDVQGVAAEAGAEGKQHPLGAGCWEVELGRDHGGAVAVVDRLGLGDAGGAGR
jgi:hypothetical protein